MKIAVLSKQTKFSEKDVIVLHFCKSLNTWFNEDTCILIFASALTCCVIFFFFFWLKYVKKILSHTDM